MNKSIMQIQRMKGYKKGHLNVALIPDDYQRVCSGSFIASSFVDTCLQLAQNRHKGMHFVFSYLLFPRLRIMFCQSSICVISATAYATFHQNRT